MFLVPLELYFGYCWISNKPWSTARLLINQCSRLKRRILIAWEKVRRLIHKKYPVFPDTKIIAFWDIFVRYETIIAQNTVNNGTLFMK